MKLYNPIENDGLIDEVLRICGTTSAVYSNKSIVARLNNALDSYWNLAFNSASNGTFDDTNQTSLPVETQNLVSGTNAYKVSSFTNEVLDIVKLSILDSEGREWDLTRQEFEDLQDFTYNYSTSITGLPSHWTKIGDYIYLYPCPDYSETNGLRAYVNREMSKFVWTPVTANVDDTLTTTTAHGLVALDGVIFETDGTIITPITADTVAYYVITDGLTTTKFKVSTSYSATGTAVNITDAQAGSNHKYTKINKEPGIPVIHHLYLARQAALPFLIEKKLPQTSSISQLIMKDERDILEYWSNRDGLSTIIQTDKRCYQ